MLANLVSDAEVSANFNMRLKKKIMSLINDLVTNDDGVFENDPFMVRKHFCGDASFLAAMREILSSADY